MTIRRGEMRDLAEIAAIQAASPEASQWDPAGYLQYGLRVLLIGGRVAGFLVSRGLAEGEFDLLNLAVAPDFRRRGVGRRLVESLAAESAAGSPAAIFLEVRESNRTARAFYKSLGFEELSVRKGYYDTPPESAIVMKFHSC